jgi:phosphate transport system substrate-binding protein
VAIVAAAIGCSWVGRARHNELSIAGSDTMLVLNRRLAEEFMRLHPGVAVRVAGGGTGSGVQALVEGSVDLCAASRPFSADEVASLHESFGTLGVRYLIARDALSVFLHPANPVRDLSMEELSRIFRGELPRWSPVGGPDRPITVVVRPPNSGSYRFFRDHVLGGGEYTPAARTAAQTSDVVEAVRVDPSAVGYGGLVYGRDLVHCRVDGAAPTPENVRRGSYPLARYLYLSSAGLAEGRVREFLDWCMGEGGQRVVEEVGFVPLWVDD